MTTSQAAADPAPAPDAFMGSLELVDGRQVVGWAINRLTPTEPVAVSAFVGGEKIADAHTALARLDVAEAHGLAGKFGFQVRLPRLLTDAEIDQVAIYLPDGQKVYDASAQRAKIGSVSTTSELRIGVFNLEAVSNLEPAHYEYVRLDPVMDCNLHCFYCHNHRSQEPISLEAMRNLLNSKVVSTENFYVGCNMEPTLDERLASIFEMIGETNAKPSKTFGLATNGTLLAKHDLQRLADAGLNEVTISIDTMDNATLRQLRGANVATIVRNINRLRSQHPDIRICLTATVTSLNIGQCYEFTRRAISLGVSRINFHQMFHFAENSLVDHGRMDAATVSTSEFFDMARRIEDDFAPSIELVFAHDNFMDRIHASCGLDMHKSEGCGA